MNNFKDNFSRQSDIYLKYRPLYPDELYAYLATLTNEHELAWDCGTGNGQAAIGLAPFYDKVIATDPSEQQIGNAIPHEKVQYLVEKAEHVSMEPGTADIITAANALHWFDIDVFYKATVRVSKPNGLIAVWAYGNPCINTEIDRVVDSYHDDILGTYWLPENRLVEDKYSTLPFPFAKIETPAFSCERSMNLDEFIGYLNTWSATQRFIVQNQFNPTEQVRKELLPVWGDPLQEKKLTWDLTLKVGRIEK